jgi:hypothetical protein
MRQTALLVLSKIVNNVFSSFSSLPIMFLTLTSMNIYLQIFPTLTLVNIAQPKKCDITDSYASE